MKGIRCYFNSCECTELVSAYEKSEGIRLYTVYNKRCPKCGRMEECVMVDFQTDKMSQVYPEPVVKTVSKAVKKAPKKTAKKAEKKAA